VTELFFDLKNFVLDTLFPLSCQLCGQDNILVCANCLGALKLAEGQQCLDCNKPSLLGLTHQRCSRGHGAAGVISVFNYKDPKVAELVIAGKYKFLPEVYKILSAVAVGRVKQLDLPNYWTDFVLCPLPLSRSRKRWRGFNQAEVICQALSENFGWSVTHALKRTRSTKTQKDLDKTKRPDNVAGSFALAPGINVKNKNFLLVDDVVTTGATLREAVKVLKRNGANQVWCLTLARD